MLYDHQLEVDLRELLRLVKERRLLELPSKLWRKYAPASCRGECTKPTPIGVLGLTCCNFYLSHERYEGAVVRERVQREAVELGRERQRLAQERRVIEGGALQEKYYRDFTGTYRGRRPPGLPEPENE